MKHTKTMFLYVRRGTATYIWLQENRKIFRKTKTNRVALRMLYHNLYYRKEPLPSNVRC